MLARPRPSTKSASVKPCSTKCGGCSARRGNCLPGRNPRVTTEARLSRCAKCGSAWKRLARCYRRRMKSTAGECKMGSGTLACSVMMSSRRLRPLLQRQGREANKPENPSSKGPRQGHGNEAKHNRCALFCAHPRSKTIAISSSSGGMQIPCIGAENQHNSKPSHSIRNGSPPICKQGVTGSIPVTSTNFPKELRFSSCESYPR